jgi:hypothetical protein
MIDTQGLYDSVRCEYSLPLPDDVDQNEMPDWSEFDFQSQSFISSCSDESDLFEINSFNIDEEGEIYRDIVERNYNETEEGMIDFEEVHKGIEKVDHSGEVCLVGFHSYENNDYFMEFKMLFWKGELKETELLTWKKQDNTERVKAQEEMKERFKKALDKKNTGFRGVWNKIIKFPFLIVKCLISLTLSTVIRVERWLSF